MRIVKAIQFPYRTAVVAESKDRFPVDSHPYWRLKEKLAKLSGKEQDNHIAYVFQTDTGRWFSVWFSDWRMVLREGTRWLYPDESPSEQSRQMILRKLRENDLHMLATVCEERWRNYRW